MASIYTKSSEKTLILAAREGMMRQFDFGAWTEMRIGMFISGVATSGDDAVIVDEDVALSGVPDRLSVGIKSNTSDLPGTAGTDFIGVISDTTVKAASTGMGVYENLGSFGFRIGGGTANGVTFNILARDNAVVNGLHFPAAPVGTGWCGFWALKIVVNNIGTATQTVSLSFTKETTVAGTDYSSAALRTKMNNGVYTSLGADLAWNDGAAARTLPDCVWVRVPFFNARLRLSCIRAIRYAPV